MIIIHVVVDAHDRRAILGLPIRGDGRNRQRNAISADETLEARRGVGLHAEPLERERIGAGDRLERIEPPSHLKGAEVKELVLNDRTADAAAELMLRVALTEGRRRGLIRRPLQMRIAQRVAERTGERVGTAASRRRHLAARELTPRYVIRIGDDASLPDA